MGLHYEYRKCIIYIVERMSRLSLASCVAGGYRERCTMGYGLPASSTSSREIVRNPFAV